MADIYARGGRMLLNIQKVFRHMQDNSFTAMRKDLIFNLALRDVQEFMGLDANEAALFCCLFCNYLRRRRTPVCLGTLSEDLDVAPVRLLEFGRQFESLESLGLITAGPSPDSHSLESYYRIPEEVIEALVAEDRDMLKKRQRTKDPNLTYPEEISGKELFYSDEIREDIASLFSYMEKDQFQAIQKRLSENKLGRGVCIMLHGDSGTGKTETVYQLGKKTGRAVYHVDIGSTISQWIGGTEENLSAIFKKYKLLCTQAEKRGENIPILLFNEADALFGKRFEKVVQSAQVESNHIQALLLDYIERQEGILIVTTNIPGIFDEAFERRFLFKIKFEKPDLEVTKKIWRSKARWLEGRSVEHLASSYALSGAEIDNVLRKATIREVLTGSRSSLNELEDLCRKEKLEGGRRNVIGFVS